MVKTIKLVCIISLFTFATLYPQVPNIRISLISAKQPEETTISINPVNPLNLAAGSNLNYYFYSMDGGYTWQQGQLTSTFGVYGDPCVVFDADGNLYYSHLSDPAFGDWLDRIVVQKSTDMGITWSDGAGIGLNPPKDQDKEWLAVDMTDSPYRNNIYMAWTEFDEYGSADPADSSRILFARSEDSGENWSHPLKISDAGGNCLDGDDTVEGAVPAVGPHGEIYVSWAGPRGLLFDRSLDGGKTFGKDIFITSQPGGWAFDVDGIFRCNGLPITACDISRSDYRGHIYVVWSDQRNSLDNTDVFLIKSVDGGETWATPVQVNNDSTNRHQFFPWIAIDPASGFIYIIFYDRRNTSAVSTDVYLARSTDGGQSFSNRKISESSFSPNQKVFFGDYINIAALNGKIYPIWMRMDETVLSIWSAVLHDSMNVAVQQESLVPADFVLFQNYPNPFNSICQIRYTLPHRCHVSLEIYDATGRQVRTLVNETQAPDTYSVSFDGGTLSSGLYFYTLKAGHASRTNKMLFLR